MVLRMCRVVCHRSRVRRRAVSCTALATMMTAIHGAFKVSCVRSVWETLIWGNLLNDYPSGNADVRPWPTGSEPSPSLGLLLSSSRLKARNILAEGETTGIALRDHAIA